MREGSINMKTYTLFSLLFFSLPAFALQEGGIDGGGGGTLPANPISIEYAENIIQHSKQDLRLLYRSFQRRMRYDTDFFGAELTAKLSGGAALIDVLEKTDIEILLDKPCHDLYGNETDGSVHASKPNAICMSVFRIAPKLSTERARAEILALITHELGHVLGADENEAVRLQYISVSYLQKTDSESASEFVGQLMKSLSAFNTDASKLWDAKTPTEELLVMDNLYKDIHAPIRDTAMALFTTEDEDYYRYQSARIMLAHWYALSVSNRSDSAEWQKKYQNVFKDDESVKLKEIPEAFAEQNIYGDLKISKINMSWDMKHTAQEVSMYAYSVNNYLMNLYLSKDLVSIPKPNPGQ